MCNKKKMIFYIAIPFTIYAAIFSIGIIAFLSMIYSEQKYYSKANWNVTRDVFYSSYYPCIKEYFLEHLNDYEISFYDEIDANKYMYDLSFDNNLFKLKIKIEVFDDLCTFQSDFYYLYDISNFKYDDIEFFDKILTDFGRTAFYDYQITDGIIYDIFDEKRIDGSYDYYFDRAIGYLGCGWSFRDGNSFNINESAYVLNIQTKSLLKDSDTFIDRLK